MPHRGVIFAVTLLSVSLALAAGGCGGKGGKPGATATRTIEATIEATATTPAETATPAPDIRREDFSRVPAMSSFLATSGGRVDPAAIIYADVTEDGVDDAVVPVSSGGEGGDIALFVFGYEAEGLTELLRVVPAMPPIKASVVEGKLQVDEPTFAPGDPMCCPSELTRTTYRWDGRQLVIDAQETVPGSGPVR